MLLAPDLKKRECHEAWGLPKWHCETQKKDRKELWFLCNTCTLTLPYRGAHTSRWQQASDELSRISRKSRKIRILIFVVNEFKSKWIAFITNKIFGGWNKTPFLLLNDYNKTFLYLVLCVCTCTHIYRHVKIIKQSCFLHSLSAFHLFLETGSLTGLEVHQIYKTSWLASFRNLHISASLMLWL